MRGKLIGAGIAGALLSLGAITLLRGAESGSRGTPDSPHDSATHGGTAELVYERIYADTQGESHFDTGRMTFSHVPGAPEALSLHVLEGAKDATILRLPAGATEDWHTAPRRQFLFVLRGTSEVTVSDGTVRRFGPGSVILMDDRHGKGHLTRVVGSEEHFAVAIPVE